MSAGSQEGEREGGEVGGGVLRRRRREVEGARGTAVAWRAKRECWREG